jgi:phage terminase large subunit GpA-like protein
MDSAESHIFKALAKSFEPKKPLTVSEWADVNRFLSSKSSAEPGRWRTSRNPLLKEPMDCLSARSPVKSIALMFPIQIGKSEVATNVVGYTQEENPGPIMVCLPGEVSLHKWINQKYNPLVEECQTVAATLTSVNSRDASNTRFFKDFLGGQIYFEHAGSPSRLKSTSVKMLIVDEVDEFANNFIGGDDPMDMLLGRTSAFPSTYKHLFISTPQIKGLSRIEQLYLASDRRRYHVPCPHCGHYQPLEWSGLKKMETGDVYYLCVECAAIIDERHKTAMFAAGKWIPESPEKKERGYTCNALYYPVGLGPSWQTLMEMWDQVQNDTARLKTFINDRLAETWEDRSMQGLKINLIADRAEDYPLRVAPKGVCMITAGVDTQDDRLEVQVIGWGSNNKFYVIDYAVIYGDPAGDSVWAELTDLLNSPIEHCNGHLLPIQATAIDAGGHRTEAVKDYVRKKQARRVMAIFGAVPRNAPVLSRPKAQDVDFKGRAEKKGVYIQHVGTIGIKNKLFGMLSADAEKNDSDDRQCHFSQQLPPEYFIGLVSETFDTRTGRFVKRKGARNEPLDTWVYAYAATHHQELRMHLYSNAKWKELEEKYSTPLDASGKAEQAAKIGAIGNGAKISSWGRR